MNTNDAIHNRNAETAPRLRFNNDPIIQNHIVYPYTYPMHQLFYPISQPVIMTTNHSQVPNMNANDQSNEQSGIMSPSSDTSVNQPPYRISSWQDIVDSYEGNEEKPKCGKLKDNVYFTQRSASSDMYMLFDRKSDYINNFVNYYFSDKNLARDHKLVALMDEKGVVPLSALSKFPKLHQIDTTVEDLIKAFQNNHFVAAVEMENTNEKGAQRRDKLCSADVVNRNGLEKSGFTGGGGGGGGEIMPTDVSIASVAGGDLHMTMANDNAVVAGQQSQQQQQQQQQSYYVYNQATLLPTIYSPQAAGIMPAAAAAAAASSLSAALPPYNPYIMTNFPYAAAAAAHASQTSQQSHIYPSPLVWPVGTPASDYGGGHAAALISQLQQQQQQQQTPTAYNHHSNNSSGAGGGGGARFLSTSAAAVASSVVNGGPFNPVQTVTVATAVSEPPAVAGSRIN